MFRVGYGTDLHRLETGLKLFLGGIEIPSDRGAKAHSDGDVIMHALCDALLGAIADGDIGDHFPDTDIAYKDKRSPWFLEKVMAVIKERGFSLGNADVTVHLEKPKLSPYKAQIRENLARILEVPLTSISLKAKTSEGLGAIGSGEAVRAEVVVLIHN